MLCKGGRIGGNGGAGGGSNEETAVEIGGGGGSAGDVDLDTSLVGCNVPGGEVIIDKVFLMSCGESGGIII